MSVLTGLGLKYQGTNISDCIQIITNTAGLFLKKKLLNIKDIQDVLYSRYSSLLNKFQIANIITSLNAQQHSGQPANNTHLLNVMIEKQ